MCVNLTYFVPSRIISYTYAEIRRNLRTGRTTNTLA